MCVSIAYAASVTDIPWEQSNIQTLRGFDKGAVAGFATQLLGGFSARADVVAPKDIGEFTWADLAGDGRDELVVTLDANGRAFFNALLIFWRDSSGKVTY